MALPSDAVLPEKVSKAVLKLVEAVNESGERCIGVVAVVVLPSGARVIPLIDAHVRSTHRENPMQALLEQATFALADATELEWKNPMSKGANN